MTDGLRRLQLHGVIGRIPRSHCFQLTLGLRIALFSSRTYAPSEWNPSYSSRFDGYIDHWRRPVDVSGWVDLQTDKLANSSTIAANVLISAWLANGNKAASKTIIGSRTMLRFRRQLYAKPNTSGRAVAKRDEFRDDAQVWAPNQASVRSEIPEQRRTSVPTSNASLPPVFRIPALSQSYHSTWVRRVPPPEVISPEFAAGDVPMALIESHRSTEGIQSICSTKLAWTNPLDARQKINLKPLQRLAHSPHGRRADQATGRRFLRWRDIKALLGASLEECSRHKVPRLGASVAFYTMLSLAPLLLVAVSIAGLVFGRQAAVNDLIYQVEDLAGPTAAKAVEVLLKGARNTTHGVIATIFGLVALLFGASGVLVDLQDALNTIWEVPTPEPKGNWDRITSFIRERLLSFALVLTVGFLLLVSLLVNAWIAALGAVAASLPAHEPILHAVNSVVSCIIIAGLFAAIYKIVPDAHIEWRDVVLGGAVTSALFTIGKLVIGIYLGRASFASTYGAAASLVVFIIWVYYSSQIFFLGAEFTRIFANRHGSQSNRQPPCVQPHAVASPSFLQTKQTNVESVT